MLLEPQSFPITVNKKNVTDNDEMYTEQTYLKPKKIAEEEDKKIDEEDELEEDKKIDEDEDELEEDEDEDELEEDEDEDEDELEEDEDEDEDKPVSKSNRKSPTKTNYNSNKD